MYKNEVVDKYTSDPEVKLILVQVLDKLNKAQHKNILTTTNFLNEQQRALAEILIRDNGNPSHTFLGGYEEAKRTILVFLPDYTEPEDITEQADEFLSCIRAEYSQTHAPTHRDFLGAIMGTGIKRETIGDILVDNSSCDIVTVKDIAPYLETNFNQAGRTKINVSVIPLNEINIPVEKTKTINDTVASLRLDSVVASCFSISRSKAADAIRAGKVTLNHLECNSIDKSVNVGSRISLRGMGKAVLKQVGNTTRKGRTRIVVERYL
ncbi:MAG: RNA-binding protein [Clostridiaceae bacterium]|jgi:RNA-binding protein YlmH|nr:RNA-binding protein [Clostridiaceae bacterium]